MDSFFGNQHASEELQGQLSQQQPQGQLSSSSQNHSPAGLRSESTLSSIADTPMIDGDTLDDIIRENDQELQRRRSIPQPYGDQLVQDETQRRMSMLEFGDVKAEFTNFQFPNEAMDSRFSGIGTNMSLEASMPNFSQQDMMQMTDGSGFSPVPSTVMGGMMPATFANMSMGSLGSGSTAMDLFTPVTMPNHFSPNQIGAPTPDFMDMNPENSSVGSTTGLGLSQREDDMIAVAPSFVATTGPSSQEPRNIPVAIQPPIPQSLPSGATSPISIQSPNQLSSQTLPQPSASQAPSSIRPEVPPGLRMGTGHGNIYSSTGFDIIRALSLVTNRPNPEVTLGAVDFSCAFVVCDVKENDCPIIYVSDNFQNLTGYSCHEIIGKNCRFLQSPDGKVEAGSKRQFIDNSSVYKLKLKIAAGQEVQQSLLNYRKGGRPFLNLLTMIPIPWDTDEIRYFIGFQIDIVENSDAIGPEGETGRGMIVNYKNTGIGQYTWDCPQITNWDAESGQTLAAEEVSALLQQFKTKGAVSDWHKPSWDKMLLENSDDVVHVLSLKGVFLYVSPSCKKVVGYTVKELTGKPLSEVCHPSDIVPVTRELKESSAGSTVNTVFRFRCKESSYTWFESHGSLFIEQGKGRKIIVLVGRKRPVFSLSRKDLEANGGVGENELWTKISPSGLFLFVSSGVRLLLDYQPDDLVGTSIQELMRKESRAEFGRSIERARSGKIVMCKHEVHHRRGQVLKAQTVLYPGDTTQSQNPTFLIAQTKLSKPSSRNVIPATSPGSIRSSGSATTRDEPSLVTGIGSAGDSGANVGADDMALMEDDDIFEELRVTKTSSWQYELRNLEKDNRKLAAELNNLSSNKKKRKRRKGLGNFMRDCANCHTRSTPEWRRGPSGQRDLCNSCGLRWAKQMGRVSPRNSSRGGNGDAHSKLSNSPIHTSPLRRDPTAGTSPQGGTAAAAGGEGTTTATGLLALQSMPPPSQPLLEGGSGQEMTIIQEERETSTS